MSNLQQKYTQHITKSLNNSSTLLNPVYSSTHNSNSANSTIDNHNNHNNNNNNVTESKRTNKYSLGLSSNDFGLRKSWYGQAEANPFHLTNPVTRSTSQSQQKEQAEEETIKTNTDDVSAKYIYKKKTDDFKETNEYGLQLTEFVIQIDKALEQTKIIKDEIEERLLNMTHKNSDIDIIFEEFDKLILAEKARFNIINQQQDIINVSKQYLSTPQDDNDNLRAHKHSHISHDSEDFDIRNGKEEHTLKVNSRLPLSPDSMKDFSIERETRPFFEDQQDQEKEDQYFEQLSQSIPLMRNQHNYQKEEYHIQDNGDDYESSFEMNPTLPTFAEIVRSQIRKISNTHSEERTNAEELLSATIELFESLNEEEIIQDQDSEEEELYENVIENVKQRFSDFVNTL